MRHAFSCLAPCAIFCAIAMFVRGAEFTINGTIHTENAEIAALPQSGRISIDAQDQPLVEVCAEISKQAGYSIVWEGDKEERITLSAQGAPLLGVLAEMGKIKGCSFGKMRTSDGEILQIPASFYNAAVLAYEVQGPLLIVWHGLTTEQKYNFEDPSKPIETTRYGIELIDDPRAHVRTAIDQPARELPVTFVLADRTRFELKSQHNPTQFSSSGPTWEFDPRPELTEGDATIEIRLPFHSLTTTRTLRLPLKTGATAAEEEMTATLERYSSENAERHDPADWFKTVLVPKHTAVFRLLHADAALSEKAAAERRELSEEEMERVARLMDGSGVLGAHSATFTDGSASLDAVVDSASGVSSPMDGYRFESFAFAADEAFRPTELVVTVAGTGRMFEFVFRVQGVKLQAR